MGFRITPNMPGLFYQTPKAESPLAARAVDTGATQGPPLPPKPEPAQIPQEAPPKKEEDFDPSTFEVGTIAEATGADPEAIADIRSKADRKPFSISELQELIGKGGPGGFNLAPVAAAIDAQTGSRMAPAFANMETPSKRRDSILKQIASSIQLQQKEESAAAKLQLARLKALQEKKEPPGSKKRRQAAIEKEFRKQFGAFDKEIGEAKGTVSSLKSALATGQISQVQLILAQLVKKIGGEVGTLSDKDIRRALLPTLADELGKIEAFLGTNPTPELSKARLDDLNFFVDNYTKKVQDLSNSRVGGYVRRAKLSSPVKEFGLDVDAYARDTNKILTQPTKVFVPRPGTVGRPKANLKDPLKMTDEELRAELGK